MQIHHALIEKLIHKYERYVAPVTFIFGFLLDTFTLQRIDFWIDHLVLIGYLLVAGAGIVVFHLHAVGRLRLGIFDPVAAFLPVLMQFGFGGLFSAFLIFYTKSAALAKSWLFLLILAVFLIGNERFLKRYQRFVFQVSVYFIALFSYSIFLLPVLTGKMGASVFLLGGAMSVALVALFVWFLLWFLPPQARRSMPALVFSIGSIYVLFHVFYFTNIIPPIPLVLKEGGIFHSVQRVDGGAYRVSYEKSPWYLPFQQTDPTYRWKPGTPIYYFTSVFAPTKLAIPIFHQWWFYDEKNGWVKQERVGFPVVGGRDGGYRGYSFKTGIRPGKWRVDVITERAQVLGQETFTVVEVEEGPPLITELR